MVKNVERNISYPVLALLLIIALVGTAAGIGRPVAAEEKTATETFDMPHMVFTDEEREQLQRESDAAPKYSAPGRVSPGSLSLLPYLTYNATERDQGHAEDCWVWAGTGALEIDHAVKNRIPDRFSIQYFLTNYGIGPQGNYAACSGGGATRFAAWYANKSADPGQKVVPWSNTNAGYNPHCTLPFTPAPPVADSPAYRLKSITVSTIPVHGMPRDEAINTIKSALKDGHAVIFSYHYSPADANAFHRFWRDQPETAIWNPARCNGDTGEGGHDMLIVGYDDNTDPKNPYWLVLNSWGAPKNRPDGTFRLDMNMNYSAVSYSLGDKTKSRPHPQHGFWILDAAFEDTPQVPVVAGISPASGTAGTNVSITGIGFTRATAVTFGGTPATAFEVTSDSTITATVPAHGGRVDVGVTTPLGTSAPSAASVYTYEGSPSAEATRSPVSPLVAAAALGIVCLLYIARRRK
nr:IPT/TIG domain-containing protein [uncultured Methanoregula sp.]